MKDKNKNPLLAGRAVIEEKKYETGDAYSLKIAPLDTDEFIFNPGQFNMLGLPGIGEAPVSFSSLIVENNSFVHTIRSAGNVTGALRGLEKGDILNIRGPYGNGWPLEKASGKHLIIVAGGIGMAPLRPVIYHVLRDRKKFLKIFLLAGSRAEEDFLYKDELKAWIKAGDISVFLSVDEKSENGVFDTRAGVVTGLMDEIDIPFDKAVTFTCGPEIMMRFAAKSLMLRGQEPEDIFVSMERRMKCGIAACGHCQIGVKYVCKDGPVFAYPDIKRFADTLL